MLRFALRLNKIGVKKYSNGFNLTFHPEIMEYPFTIKSPKMIFVNSMSDLYHKEIPFEFMDKVFDVMKRANWHQYQILTKRSQGLKEFGKYYGRFPHNVWIGVSVESDLFKNRINHLREVKANIHFISFEPLLGPVGKINLDEIEWVIAGGESGFRFRECRIECVREIRDQCVRAGVPFFFKQWGGINSKSKGRTLDNRLWGEFPKSTNTMSVDIPKQRTLWSQN